MQISLLLMEEIAKLFALCLWDMQLIKARTLRGHRRAKVSLWIMVYLVIPCVILNGFQVEYITGCTEGTAPGMRGSSSGTYPVFDAYSNLKKYPAPGCD